MSSAADRRARVADLTLAGLSAREVAASLGVARATVQRDLRALRAVGPSIPPVRHRPTTSRRTPIAVERVQRGMTQRDLAEATGLSVGCIARAEAGHAVHRDTARRLREVLTVDAAHKPAAIRQRLPRFAEAALSPRAWRVAELYAAGTPPGAIARRLRIGRATVYRDVAAARAAGVTLPPLPMGRRPA